MLRLARPSLAQRLLLLLPAYMLVAGCGEGVEASTESVKHRIPDTATFYLPEYRDGAGFVDDGLGGDTRERDAQAELASWRAQEHDRDSGTRVGERSVVGSPATGQTDSGSAAVPQGAEGGILVAPVFTELATVCDGPATVALFGNDEGSDPPALQQYENASAIEERELPSEVVAAWQVETLKDVRTFAYQVSGTEEVLVVVSAVSSDCTLDDVSSQVGVHRGGGE